jgi:hypothetical protein
VAPRRRAVGTTHRRDGAQERDTFFYFSVQLKILGLKQPMQERDTFFYFSVQLKILGLKQPMRTA